MVTRQVQQKLLSPKLRHLLQILPLNSSFLTEVKFVKVISKMPGCTVDARLPASLTQTSIKESCPQATAHPMSGAALMPTCGAGILIWKRHQSQRNVKSGRVVRAAVVSLEHKWVQSKFRQPQWSSI